MKPGFQRPWTKWKSPAYKAVFQHATSYIAGQTTINLRGVFLHLLHELFINIFCKRSLYVRTLDTLLSDSQIFEVTYRTRSTSDLGSTRVYS